LWRIVVLSSKWWWIAVAFGKPAPSIFMGSCPPVRWALNLSDLSLHEPCELRLKTRNWMKEKDCLKYPWSSIPLDWTFQVMQYEWVFHYWGKRN
jgi:hypothetical protein